MKRLYIITIITALLFTSCATVSRIPSSEVGIPPDVFSGDFVKATTSGGLYAGNELCFIARWAKQHNYKYVVVLDKATAKSISSYTANTYGNTITVSPNYRYSGAMVAYCFSSKEEYQSFLENAIGVYNAEDYASTANVIDAVKYTVSGITIVGGIVLLVCFM